MKKNKSIDKITTIKDHKYQNYKQSHNTNINKNTIKQQHQRKPKTKPT